MSDRKNLFDNEDDLFRKGAGDDLFGRAAAPTPRQQPKENPPPVQPTQTQQPAPRQSTPQQAPSPRPRGVQPQRTAPRPAAPKPAAPAATPTAPRPQSTQPPQRQAPVQPAAGQQRPAASAAGQPAIPQQTPSQAQQMANQALLRRSTPQPAANQQRPAGQSGPRQAAPSAAPGQRPAAGRPAGGQNANQPPRQSGRATPSDATSLVRNPANNAEPDEHTIIRGAVRGARAGMDDPTRVQEIAGQGEGGGSKNGGGNGGKRGNGKKTGKNGKRKGTFKYVMLNLLKAFFCLGCAGAILVSVLAVQVAAYVVESTVNDDLFLDLNNIRMSQTGYVKARDPASGQWVDYYTITGESDASWVYLSEVSPYVINALIATEDREFGEHSGVSWTRTAAAALNEVFGFQERQFGGSTIHQQLVKNLTDDRAGTSGEGGASAGYMRKVREIFRARSLHNNYGDDLVLEAYLNTMPLSGTIIGVGAGSRKYFNKEPMDLAIHEAATIVGITNSPWRYDPYMNPDNCIARRNNVLFFMHRDGHITDAEYQNAVNQPLGLYTGQRQGLQSNEMTDWFVDALFEELIQDFIDAGLATNRTEASTYLYNNGLVIESTVNPDIQSEMSELFLHAYEEGSTFPASVHVEEEDGTIVYPQSSMTLMDYEGNVLAIVGGVGEKEGSRVLNRAYSSPRQVGSTMKAVATYALGLEYNLIHYSSMLMDSYCWWRDGQAKYNEDGTPAYDYPVNYTGAPSNTPQPLYNAVATSSNTVAVRVGLMVGVEEIYEYVTETFRISQEQMIPSASEDLTVSSMILGGNSIGLTTMQLTSIYAMYGNGGLYYQPKLYERVLDSQGNVILTAPNIIVQAVGEDTAYIMNRLLYTVMNVSGGTANGIGVPGFESVGKTGTTSNDKDRLFVGLTPYYVSAIWWGYDDNYEIVHSPSASTNATTQTWRALMGTIHEGLEPKSFPDKPESVKTTQFCRDTGMLPAEGCENLGTGYYKSDYEPETCPGHG